MATDFETNNLGADMVERMDVDDADNMPIPLSIPIQKGTDVLSSPTKLPANTTPTKQLDHTPNGLPTSNEKSPHISNDTVAEQPKIFSSSKFEIKKDASTFPASTAENLARPPISTDTEESSKHLQKPPEEIYNHELETSEERQSPANEEIPHDDEVKPNDTKQLSPKKEVQQLKEKPKKAEPSPTKQAASAEKGETKVKRPRSSVPKQTPKPEAPPPENSIASAAGKRQRKQIERLDVSVSTPRQKEFEIPEGRGKKLGDIEYVNAMITNAKVEELKPLHRILYARVGSQHEIKKNLRAFCGFEFDADSEKAKSKKVSIEKFKNKELQQTCNIFGLQKGTHQDMANVIFNYVLCPIDENKKPPSHGKKRKSSTGSGKKKRESKGKKSNKTTATKPSSTKETEEDKSDSDEDEDDENDESEEDKEEERDEVSEPEAEEPKAKRARKTVTPVTTPSKVSPTRRAAAQPSTSSVTPKKTAGSHQPSDSDIKKKIQQLLKGADLEKVTMKTITKQVFDAYPGFDLGHKKEFIKATVKSVLSTD